MEARKMAVGAENIALERMDALLFIARKLSLSHLKNIMQYNNVLRTFLTKFVAIVTASSEVCRSLQRKVFKSVFKSF